VAAVQATISVADGGRRSATSIADFKRCGFEVLVSYAGVSMPLSIPHVDSWGGCDSHGRSSH
jgi:hypothetical protein